MSFLKNLTASTFLILSLFVGVFFASNTQTVFADSVSSTTTVYVANVNQDCVGTWSACVSNSKSFTVTTPASGTGAACPVPLTTTCTSSQCNSDTDCDNQAVALTGGGSGLFSCNTTSHQCQQKTVTTCALVTLWGGTVCSSGQGSITASNCTIPNGGSTCSSGVTWSSWNTRSLPSWGRVAKQGGSSMEFNGNYGSGTSNISFGSTRFELWYQYRANIEDNYYQDVGLDNTVANAVCADPVGHAWNGSSCGTNGQPPVDCAGNWSVCSNNSQSFTVTTQPANGGAACPASPRTCGGTSTLSGTSCTIASGASTCDMGVNWFIYNPGNLGSGVNGPDPDCNYSGNSGSGLCRRGLGSYDFQLQLGTDLLTPPGVLTLTASCGGTSEWIDGKCQEKLEGTISATPCTIASGGSTCEVDVVASITPCNASQRAFFGSPNRSNSSDQGCIAEYPKVLITFGAGQDIMSESNSYYRKYDLFKTPGSQYVKSAYNSITCTNSTWDIASGRCLSSIKLQGSLTVSNKIGDSCTPVNASACCTILDDQKTCQIDLAYYVYDSDYPGGGGPYESNVTQRLTGHKRTLGVPWTNVDYTDPGYYTLLNPGYWQMLETDTNQKEIKSAAHYVSTNTAAQNSFPWKVHSLYGYSRTSSPFTVQYGITEFILNNTPSAGSRDIVTISKKVSANCGTNSVWDNGTSVCKSAVTTFSIPDCVISVVNASTCTTNLDWSAFNPSGAVSVNKTTPTSSLISSAVSGTSPQTLTGYVPYTYTFKDAGLTIDRTLTPKAKCADGLSWINQRCEAGALSLEFNIAKPLGAVSPLQILKGTSVNFSILPTHTTGCTTTSSPVDTSFNSVGSQIKNGSTTFATVWPQVTTEYTVTCTPSAIGASNIPKTIRIIVKSVIDTVER